MKKVLSIAIMLLMVMTVSAQEQLINGAIEKKQVVEQQTKTSQLELEKAKIDNEKRVENAKADAEVMRLQNSQITEQTLRLKELEIKEKLIDKWDGKYPTTMVGENANALFNFGN